MHFTFATAARIEFGPGASRCIPDLAATLGKRACLVIGSRRERARWLIDAMAHKGLEPVVVTVSGEPDVGLARDAARRARHAGCDVVVSMGGGSVLDTGKAVAALIANQRDIFDYLEVVGQGQPLEAEPAPLIAAPTTSGTGAEVSANAVLLSPEHGVKVSLRSPRMIPNAAVVDPELALGVPPAVTAATGMDALTQLLEAYVSPTASPVTSALCLEGLARAAASLRPAFADGSDLTARTDMALAALLSGMALANGKLGAAHGFAAPLGGAFHAPHGAVCAALLPAVMAVNIAALRERRPHSPALERYADVGRVLAGDAAADQDGGAALGVAWVRETCKLLDIPPLSAMGVADADLDDLATKAQRASSMQGNPVELTREELLEILRLAM